MKSNRANCKLGHDPFVDFKGTDEDAVSPMFV